MKVAVYDEAYDTILSCALLDNVIRKEDFPSKYEEAVHFLRETGRYWFNHPLTGQRRYVTHVEG